MKIHEYKTYQLNEVQDFVEMLREIQAEVREAWVEDRSALFGMDAMLDGSPLVGISYAPANVILEGLVTYLQLIAGRVYQMSRVEIRLYYKGSLSWLDASLPRQA